METLRSEGFYDARIETRIDQSATPVDVTLHVDTGPIYLLEAYDIFYADPISAQARGVPKDIEDLDLHVGMYARAASIVQARRDLIRRLGEIGYPLAEISAHDVTVDHERTTMRVSVAVKQGPAVTFGALDIVGLTSISEDYVRRLVPWKPGEIYDRRKIEVFRKRLVRTELFNGLTIKNASAPDGDGRLPVNLRVIEAKHKSVGAGASFSTDVGFSGNVFWEHRNLFGQNEMLTLSTRIGEIEQEVGADFTKPNFRRPDQSFLLNGDVRRQDHEAFTEKGASVFAGIERELAASWRVRTGGSIEHSILMDNLSEGRSTLFGVPSTLSRDGTDDLLHPTEGTRVRFAATPYYGTFRQPVSFVSLEATGSGYIGLDREDRFVLAARARIGDIVGENRSSIPANKRFYAGGGGSVRGYPFESVGPLDSENDPLGGRSVLELGLETRIKLSETVGVVPFIDGGSAAEGDLPETLDNVRWAVGIGARYFTGIGPLRLDVAFPLARRAGVDSAFEVYVSIGQAF